MRYLLDAVYLILVIIAAPVLLRAKSRRGLISRFLGRAIPPTPFSGKPKAPAFRRATSAGAYGLPLNGPAPRVWFHGVSVGEIHLLRNVVARWRARRPDVRCVISSTTDTGFAEAQKRFPDLTVIRWPLDFSWAIDRALREVRPDLVVLGESELWPNFLLAAKRRRVPVVAINVRLSPRSLRHFSLVRSIAKRWLGMVHHFAVQTEAYAAALRKLGVDARRVSVTGSVKYDGVSGDRGNAKTAELRSLLGLERVAGAESSKPRIAPENRGFEDSAPATRERPLIWIAGSTQAPEEQIALDVYQRLNPQFPNLRLMLVPRQRERFDEVAEMLRVVGVPFERRSELCRPSPPGFAGGEGMGVRGDSLAESVASPSTRRANPPHPHPLSPAKPGERGDKGTCRADVILLDTIGELSAAWGLADVAFVGGSLDGRRGGQNMIEPAAYGAAVLFGPHTWNFRDTVERLLAANAAIVVRDAAEMEAVVGRLLGDAGERARLGEAARRLVREQQGATERTLDVLERFLPPVSASRAA